MTFENKTQEKTPKKTREHFFGQKNILFVFRTQLFSLSKYPRHLHLL